MSSARPGAASAALVGVVIFAGLVAWFGIVKPNQRGEAPAPSAATAPDPRASGGADQTGSREAQASAPTKPAEASAEETKAASRPTGEALPPAAEAAKAGGPSFDVVRVEPTGESVIAGRGAPGATIDMLRNGRSHARALADQSGLFALVPPPLPAGSHEIILQSIAPDGTRAQSREAVTIVIGADRKTQPLVALSAPDRPTVVLSTPEPSTKTAGVPDSPTSGSQAASTADPEGQRERAGVKIASVEAEEGGRLFVSGSAAAGATVRLYLNEAFIAPGGTGSDGRVSFGIQRGVKPGDYRVRLDEVDPVSGNVKSRAEVAFHVPAPLTALLPPEAPPVAGSGVPVASAQEHAATAVTSAVRGSAPGRGGTPPGRTVAAAGPSATAPTPNRSFDPDTVVVPEINTTRVARGQNLWEISRRIYGAGTRYTIIYEANQAQIRNPDLIYPGQVFVLPSQQSPAVIR